MFPLILWCGLMAFRFPINSHLLLFKGGEELHICVSMWYFDSVGTSNEIFILEPYLPSSTKTTYFHIVSGTNYTVLMIPHLCLYCSSSTYSRSVQFIFAYISKEILSHYFFLWFSLLLVVF